jgi:hypothetical protein
MPASVCLTRKIRARAAGNGAAKHEWKNSFDNYTCQNLSLCLFLVAKNKSWRCAVWAVQFFNANSTHPSCLQDFFGDAS